MRVGKKGLVLIFILLLALPLTYSSAENIIINSKEWKDVYSGMLYGFMSSKSPQFLTSEPHSTLILNTMFKDENITIFSSKKRPFVFGYESTVKSKGYENVKETVFDSLSLELAKDLADMTNFIIIDDSYGYNAIAVVPYARISKSYVLFADRTNIAEIEDFLDDRNPDNVLIYGHVDREVLNSLDRFNPEIINEDGDRFANNVEIVKKYLEKKEVGQVILTNGEFIEETLMAGEYPTVFIGRNNVPAKIKEYITNSPINTGVLIGNELVSTATMVRRELGIAVFVKFARSARDPQGPVAEVEDLDYFFVPSIALSLNISGVRYNRLTRQVEITYQNFADVVTYFKGSYTVIEGENEQTFGDLDTVFIAANSYKTIAYDIEPLTADNAVLDVYTIYGESKNSLELVLDDQFPISTIELKDDTQIQFLNAYYDKTKERFVVVIENIGEREVFVDTEIIDILIQKESQTLSSEEIIKIKPGKTGKAYILAELEEEDIEDNPNIRVRAYYGERENALIKILEQEFELEVKKATLITYLPTIIIILLLLLMIFSMTKKKCPNCDHKNSKFRKRCSKCNINLK